MFLPDYVALDVNPGVPDFVFDWFPVPVENGDGDGDVAHVHATVHVHASMPPDAHVNLLTMDQIIHVHLLKTETRKKPCQTTIKPCSHVPLRFI